MQYLQLVLPLETKSLTSSAIKRLNLTGSSCPPAINMNVLKAGGLVWVENAFFLCYIVTANQFIK
jgi:hypothetical protein